MVWTIAWGIVLAVVILTILPYVLTGTLLILMKKEFWYAVAGIVVLIIVLVYYSTQNNQKTYTDGLLTPTPITIPSSTPFPTSTIEPEIKTTNVTPKPTIAPITHDGSKTGPIVKYHEMSTNQDIQVYENELILFTWPNGYQDYLTQGDVNWVKKYALPNLK